MKWVSNILHLTYSTLLNISICEVTIHPPCICEKLGVSDGTPVVSDFFCLTKSCLYIFTSLFSRCSALPYVRLDFQFTTAALPISMHDLHEMNPHNSSISV